MWSCRSAVVTACLSAVCLCGAQGETFRFDMGPEKSPLWPGFTRVTAKMVFSPERGYGWVSRGLIQDFKNFQPDDLARDLVAVKLRYPLEFRVRVPNR